MGSRLILLLVLAALLAGGGAMAETSDDCTSVIMSMSPCLNYITGNSSSSSSPSAGCCTQLSTVVRNNPRCLCQVLTGGGSTLGLSINRTQALALPASCNVQTPSVSRCTGVGSPSRSPSGTTSSSPNSSRSEGGSSSKSTSSSATMNAIKLTRSPLIIAIPLLASYVFTFAG